jgi:hypothetical protein
MATRCEAVRTDEHRAAPEHVNILIGECELLTQL